MNLICRIMWRGVRVVKFREVVYRPPAVMRNSTKCERMKDQTTEAELGPTELSWMATVCRICMFPRGVGRRG